MEIARMRKYGVITVYVCFNIAVEWLNIKNSKRDTERTNFLSANSEFWMKSHEKLHTKNTKLNKSYGEKTPANNKATLEI